LSPDPYLGSMDLSNPQSLNRYSYVLNNPTNFIDPLGLCPFGTHSDDTQDGKCVLDDEGPPPGGGGGGGGTDKKQKKCAKKMENSVKQNLKPTSTKDLGPASGKGIDSSGMKGGAFNENFFVTGVNFGTPGSRGAIGGAACGRFSDGLHIPNPGEPGCLELHDPTILGPTTMDGTSGFQFTAHIDSGDANTFLGAVLHIIIDVILGNLGVHHGC
jgi:hypothetical protein